MTRQDATDIMEIIYAEVRRPGMYTDEAFSELKGAFAWFFVYEGAGILLEVQDNAIFIDEMEMDKDSIVRYIIESFDDLEGKYTMREIPANK